MAFSLSGTWNSEPHNLTGCEFSFALLWIINQNPKIPGFNLKFWNARKFFFMLVFLP